VNTLNTRNWSIYTNSDFHVALCCTKPRDLIATDPSCVSCGITGHGTTQKYAFVLIDLLEKLSGKKRGNDLLGAKVRLQG
jgi:hypothetical protein